MMGLHALEGMNEAATAFHTRRTILSQKGALDTASGGKSMGHFSPRLLWICAKVAGAIIPNNESRRRFCDLDVYDTLRIYRGLDRI